MLTVLIKSDDPAKVLARHSRATEVMCGVADASGRGIGSNVQSEATWCVNIRIGVWSTAEEEKESSNWK